MAKEIKYVSSQIKPQTEPSFSYIYSVSLSRRLAAMIYDTFLVISLFILGTFFFLLFTHGNTIEVGNRYYQWFLILVGLSFFIGCWGYRGQTTGMAAWHLRLISTSGKPLSYSQATIRAFFAVLTLLLGGIGLWWALWDRQHLPLYDRLAKTRLILVTKKGVG